MSLLHLSLPSLSSYRATHALQNHLVRDLLDLKARSPFLPSPLILTMELLPTYTFGRRQQITPQDRASLSQLAAVVKSRRGGLTTYHGPGQLVGYPILDLKQHKLAPRCYVHALESSIICACSKYGVTAFRTKDTGVWVSTAEGEKKIGSIGIHLRRNITSHGVSINVTKEVRRYFDMIDACGLGKGVTTLEEMGVNTTREDVERDWVECLAEELDKYVYKLRDVRELEEIWGLKKGEILTVMMNNELDEETAQ